jgi:hypothetical protein
MTFADAADAAPTAEEAAGGAVPDSVWAVTVGALEDVTLGPGSGRHPRAGTARRAQHHFPFDEEARYRPATRPGRRGILQARPFAAASDNLIDNLVQPVVYSLIFTVMGILVFGVAFFVMTKITPFSIRKEIEEDQNTSLGIVIGSVIIGLALIISSAIKG